MYRWIYPKVDENMHARMHEEMPNECVIYAFSTVVTVAFPNAFFNKTA